MIQRGVRIQLVVFLVVAISAIGYTVVRFTGLTDAVNPPYTVSAHFTQSGGIYPLAEVDLLGTPVGSVAGLRLGPNGDTIADLTINHGVRIPRNVTAAVVDRSALGEQYVELTPKDATGPILSDHAEIPASRTSSPIPIKDLLAHLNTFAATVPTKDLQTDLAELATAFNGTGPDLQHLLDDSNALTKTGLANLDDTISLINASSTVLDTQASSGAQITTFSHQLAGLTGELRDLDPTFAQTFGNGIRAGQQVTGLLADNSAALPQLLDHLLSTTDVTGPRLGALRKSLVVFPWVLQSEFDAIRYCDANDPKTGNPIQRTCHYDRDGKPIWSEHFALQLDEPPTRSPDTPCVKGYEGTVKYLPNGQPANGSGPPESEDAPANRAAHCAAPPTDPNTPNVRGAQNAARPGDSGIGRDHPTGPDTAGPPMALYDPNSGTVATTTGQAYQLTGQTGPPPPTGASGLAWLLTQPLGPQGG